VTTENRSNSEARFGAQTAQSRRFKEFGFTAGMLKGSLVRGRGGK